MWAAECGRQRWRVALDLALADTAEGLRDAAGTRHEARDGGEESGVAVADVVRALGTGRA